MSSPSRRPCQAWFEEVEAALGSEALSTDPAALATYGRDWTRVFAPAPSAVAFPRSTAEVAVLLRLCDRHDVAVVPSGGRTGLAGGALAAHGEVVLSLERMRRLGEVDPIARTLWVEAGCVTQAVHQHAAEAGLTWPVDFASSGSSQIGGNIATNAGGVRVVRYGLTRQWVIGLTVVTMQGEILELNGALEKNNTGIDLRQLFIGSEGILGVITEATLKLTPLPRDGRVALLGVDDLAAALQVFGAARAAHGFELLAFEYLTDRCLDLVLEETGQSSPFAARSPAYVLVELEPGVGGEAGAEDRWLESLFERALVRDGVLAESAKQSRDLWTLRERISETLSKRGFVHKNDVSIPVSALAPFTAEMMATFEERYPDFVVYFFGHIGDGNLHVNVMKPPAMPQADFLAQCHHTDALLFELIRKHRGSISAEHGIGLLKKSFLGYSRTPAELSLFRGLKAVLDPKGLLNPGKIFDPAPGQRAD
jgi:FAD/FMN-containing dehydrogenase